MILGFQVVFPSSLYYFLGVNLNLPVSNFIIEGRQWNLEWLEQFFLLADVESILSITLCLTPIED